MNAPATHASTLEALKNRKPRHALPQQFYVDPDIYRVDIEEIFYRHWMFVGTSCEVASPGDYFTISIGGSPIIVLRDEAGVIRAFHNSCRHRGSRICVDDKGKASTLVCPYHQWTYSLSGNLLSGHLSQSDFDQRLYSLKPIHLATVGGIIFVCLAETAPDFALHRSAVEPYLAPQNLENAKLACEMHWPVRGNWKLMVENSRECYHCRVQHPELMRTFETLDYRQIDVAHAELRKRCAAAGLPAALNLGEDFQVLRVPFAEGIASVTMDGRPAVSGSLGTLPIKDAGSVRWAHFPSLYANIYADHAFLLRMLPIGPQESVLTGKWLVPTDAVPGRDYTVDDLTHVWAITNAQDKLLIERNQEGVNSRGYEPGPYSEKDEPGVIRFVDWYCSVIERQLGRPRQKRGFAA